MDLVGGSMIRQFRIKDARNDCTTWNQIDKELGILYIYSPSSAPGQQSTEWNECFNLSIKGCLMRQYCHYNHACLNCLINNRQLNVIKNITTKNQLCRNQALTIPFPTFFVIDEKAPYKLNSIKIPVPTPIHTCNMDFCLSLCSKSKSLEAS